MRPFEIGDVDPAMLRLAKLEICSDTTQWRLIFPMVLKSGVTFNDAVKHFIQTMHPRYTADMFTFVFKWVDGHWVMLVDARRVFGCQETLNKLHLT